MRTNRINYNFLIWIIAFTLSAFVQSCESNVRNGTRIPPLVKKTKAESEKDALLLLTELIIRNIDTDANYFKRARIYFEQGRFSQALIDINKAIDEQKNEGEYFLLRGKINREIGEIEQAQEDIERAEALQQNSPELYVILADILQAKGKVKEARKYLTNAMQMSPYDGTAYYVKGMIEMRQGDSLESLSSFNNALSLNPHLLRAYVQSAHINRRMQRYDQALAINKSAIKRFPDIAELYFENGEIYRALSKSDTALIYYKKSIKLNPQNPTALYHIAAIQIKQKAFYRALVSLEQLQKLKPEYRNINNMIGLCYEKLGNNRKARAHYNITLTMNKNDKDALNGLWRMVLRDRGQKVEDY